MIEVETQSPTSKLDALEFDTSSKEFQVSEEFLPDKESTWKYPAEKDGWVKAHDSLRGEIRDLKDALQAIADRKAQEDGEGLLDWEIEQIKIASDVHFTDIKGHHENEDHVFVPFVKTRFNYPNQLVTDHEGLEAMILQLQDIINNLKPGDKVDELLQTVETYQALVVPHLQQEEDTALFLMRAYFTVDEIKPVIKIIMDQSPITEIGSMLYYMGEDYFCNEFMIQEGIPIFLWEAHFKPMMDEFVKTFVNPVKALKSGQKPELLEV